MSAEAVRRRAELNARLNSAHDDVPSVVAPEPSKTDVREDEAPSEPRIDVVIHRRMK